LVTRLSAPVCLTRRSTHSQREVCGCDVEVLAIGAASVGNRSAGGTVITSGEPVKIGLAVITVEMIASLTKRIVVMNAIRVSQCGSIFTNWLMMRVSDWKQVDFSDDHHSIA
jgi:hypothetical protein